MTTLYLCGAGNAEGVRLARRVLTTTQQWDRLVLLDDDPGKRGTSVLGVQVVGPIDDLELAAPGSAAVNLVARTTAGRAAVQRRMVESGVPMATLVHPGIDTSDSVLAPGVLVYEQAILSPETEVGEGSVVFMRALVGHGATVRAGCVLAAGSVLNARVVLDERVYVGSNASILPDLHVGAGATIGANSLVATDVPAGATVVGVPGQILSGSQPMAMGPDDLPACGAPIDIDLERRLLSVLHQVLGHTRAMASDNFFDVGGSSLRAIQFLEAIRTELGHDVPLQSFYAASSVRGLAGRLSMKSMAVAARLGQFRGRLRRQVSGH